MKLDYEVLVCFQQAVINTYFFPLVRIHTVRRSRST